MSSSSHPLPIIDIAPWLPSSTSTDAEKQAVADALHVACRDFGFFYLNLAGFATEPEMSLLTSMGSNFFHLPQHRKDAIGLAHSDGARGYQRLKENVTMGKADNHEGIDFYRPVEDPDKRKPLWGENQWPDEDPTEARSIQGFREMFEAWVEKMKVLGLVVMQAMARGLGMTTDEWLDLRSKVDDSFWVMRIIGYPPLPSDHDGFSCGAHKDYGCLTFLYADPTPNALQVFLPSTVAASSHLSALPGSVAPPINLPNEQGAQQGIWIPAGPVPGCVVCNIGEMWETWTNGMYKSTLHRVIHRSSNYRVSVPFFFEPNFTAHVAPLAAALRIQAQSRSDDDQGGDGGKVDTSSYPPVVYGEFLKRKVAGNFSEDATSGKTGRY